MEFWKTEYWKEYLLNSRNNNSYIDHSFYINNQFVPLLKNHHEFYSPYFEDDKIILSEIKRLAIENNIRRIKVDSAIKSYLNISGYTCVLDLNNIKLSKGHKSAIKKANKFLDYEILQDTKQFMLDYFEIAGKVTRPIESFVILKNWIKLGFGTLLKATYQENTAGYIYILHYKDYAYYFMSGTFEKYKQFNVTHFLQSKAFEILKEKGIKYYELGDQLYNSLTYNPTDKDINISLFKRKFNGEIIYKPKSEYFFDKEYMKNTMEKRINNYILKEYI